jgi:predicted ribosomally synthesized peptide with nif11-like leader
MANPNVDRFLEQLCNDASLRAQFRASGAAKSDEILDFAMAKGYTFTEADLRETLKTFPDHAVIDELCTKLKVSRPKPAANV